MEASDLVMKIWNIQEQHKKEVEHILAKAAPEQIEDELASLMQHPSDDDFDHDLDAWLPTYFRNLRFGGQRQPS